jgi:hypothetical protein
MKRILYILGICRLLVEPITFTAVFLHEIRTACYQISFYIEVNEGGAA